MVKKLAGPIPSVNLGTVSDGCIKITNIVIAYTDNNDNTTTVAITGLAKSDKPVSIAVDIFLYNKASDSDFLIHQAFGDWPLSSIPRAVGGAFSLIGSGKRPAYATFQLYEEWITAPLRPVNSNRRGSSRKER